MDCIVFNSRPKTANYWCEQALFSSSFRGPHISREEEVLILELLWTKVCVTYRLFFTALALLLYLR